MSSYPANAAFPITPTVRWLLDEASGNRAGHTGGVTLTDVNTVGAVSPGLVLANASFSNAADFIASNNERLVGADTAVLDLTGAFTISFFAKMDIANSNSRMLIHKWNQDANGAAYRIYHNGGNLFFAVSPNGNASGTKEISCSFGSTGVWYHFIFVYDPSTRMEIYRDGVSQVESGSSIPSSCFNSGRDVEIGGSNLDSNWAFDGKLNDMIFVKGTAASDTQAANFYSVYTTPPVDTATPLVAAAVFAIPSVSALFSAAASVAPVSALFSVVSPSLRFLNTKIVAPSSQDITSPKFTFLVQSIDGTFRYATEAWEFDEISREINGSMMVKIKTDQLTKDIANSITNLMNRITIRISTPFTGSQGIQYFSGYIPNRGLNLQPDNQSVEITAFGYASRLFDIPYRTGTTIAIDKTGGITASNLAKDVIDKVIALDANFPANYTATSVEDSVDTVKDKFILLRAGEVLTKAVFLAFDASRIWYWTILGDNVFRFKKNSTSADHSFAYGREVLTFPNFSEDLQQARNEIMVVYNAGGNVKRVADSGSITTHGLRSETVNETNVPDSPTAIEIGNAHLATRTPPIRSISVTIGSNYARGIENINPGDTCRIDNLPPDITALLTNNMFITKTTYRKDTVDLELSLKHPFIQNQIEVIRRRLEKESVESIAATTYA